VISHDWHLLVTLVGIFLVALWILFRFASR
jgi:hypothetical protein